MDFLKKLINKISPGIKKGIGVYLSSSSTLEIVEYDYDLGEINNYNKIDFDYNSVQREINIENFEIALQNILKRFEISPQIPVTLTIPSIFINKKILPSDLVGEEIQMALLSETEKNYIFKRAEPSVSWNIISTDKESQLNTILYSALQKNLVERIEDVFKRQGLKLISLETAYEAFVRGISVSGLVDDCIEKNLNWCALIIKNNIHAAITLKGNQVLNIIETPLALNSFETDDLYPSLSSSLIEKMQDAPVESLVIANYSNLVDTDNLITNFDFKCPVVKINNNCYKGEALFTFTPYGPSSYSEAVNPEAIIINPEVIGSSCWKNAPVKFGFNFLNSKGQDEMPGLLASLGVSGNPLHVVLLGLISVAFVLITLISLIAIPINISLDEQYKQLFVKCSEYQAKFDKPQTKVFNLFDVVKTGFSNNEKIITSYDAISGVIPEKVWITSIGIDEDLNASIQGKAYNVEDIVSYYENLLSVSKFNNFKIKSIKVVGDNTGTPNNTPDVSVNTVGNNQQPPQDNPMSPTMQPPQDGSQMLPPPPPQTSVGAGSQMASIVGPKYYEFDFGNPAEVPAATTGDATQGQQKGLLSDLSKNLKLGN